MDYKDDLDCMDLSEIHTDYEAKKEHETHYQRSMKKNLASLGSAVDELKKNQVMQSQISYASAKALYEKEQTPEMVVVPVPVPVQVKSNRK